MSSSITDYIKSEHLVLEGAAERVARLGQALSQECLFLNTILNEHAAAEDQHLKPLYQQGHSTSEIKDTEATLSKFDKIAHSFSPLLLSMRQQSEQLKEFVEALRAHDNYETSTLLPQLDARLPTAERDSLLAAMRAKSGAKPELKSVDRAASGGATGLSTTSTGTGQPSFVGPDYVR